MRFCRVAALVRAWRRHSRAQLKLIRVPTNAATSSKRRWLCVSSGREFDLDLVVTLRGEVMNGIRINTDRDVGGDGLESIQQIR